MTDVAVAQVIRWEEPPPAGASLNGGGPAGSRWDGLAHELRAAPGRWALVAEGMKQGSAASMANIIRRGGYVCFRPSGDFDAVCRSKGDVAKVYARYLGDGAL